MNVTTINQTVYVITNEDNDVTVTTEQDITNYLQDVIAGTNVTIDKTDPKNPIINATDQSSTVSIQTVTSAATVTALATNDYVDITAQAVGLTLANPSGTPTNFAMIVYRIEDDGNAQTIAVGSQFRRIAQDIPTTTVAGKITCIVVSWHPRDSKWDVVNVIQQS